MGPDDVVIDGAKNAKGTQAARPAKAAKDVGIRADRADGFVLRNVTVRSRGRARHLRARDRRLPALEASRSSTPSEYGVLTFTSGPRPDADCEAMGHGDSGLYPGAGAESGEQREEKAAPLKPGDPLLRLAPQRARLLGHDGNGTRVHHNNFYDNGAGFTTDLFFAGGHPGFPQDWT